MKRHIDSGKYSSEELDGIAKELATWANHATGSGKGVFTASQRISSAFFGPKLVQSYWNRLLGDPWETAKTWGNWKNATEGEKIVATQRLKGLMTAITTYLGMLYANQAILQATHQKDEINWNDPSQSDWLAFKGFGMRIGIPGAMHAEINLVGKIITNQMMTPESLQKAGMMVPKNVDQSKLAALRQDYLKKNLKKKKQLTLVVALEQELRPGIIG